ncbi:cytochrome P450 [Nocardiopsis mangrovi]|uniref:Cytochrome P450 n=1 Tax=Nocardiopsis mangrovi TaxID=1179818 RepID=A0ABV9E1R9_9ACTN
MAGEPVVLHPPFDIDGKEIADRLLAAGPVARVQLPGLALHAVTHNAELRRVLSDTETFVRGAEHWRAVREGEVDRDAPLIRIILGSESMLARNGADHRRLRRLLQDKFSHRRIHDLRPRIAGITRDLLDDMGRAGGTVDVKAVFARPLPTRVLCELLGVTGDDDIRTMSDYTSRSFSGTGRDDVDEARAFIVKLIAEKRRDPGEDLISALVSAHGDDRLSDMELIDNVRLLVVAGFETTMGALTNVVRALLTHPDQYALLRSGRVGWDAVIEEVLRWDTSVALLPAVFTTREVELGGVTLPEGEALLLGYSAANRDPNAFAGADRLDFTRPASQNLVFGHHAHRCLGEPLARAELGVALPMLFERFPDIALTGERIRPTPSPMMNHPLELKVRLTAGG